MLRRPPPPTDHDLVLLDGGFRVATRDGLSPVVHFRDCTAAIAWKLDLFTLDCICLAFRLRDESWIALHEDMRGWLPFCRELDRHFPGIDARLTGVAYPPFQTCTTVLFGDITPDIPDAVWLHDLARPPTD